MVIMFFKYLKFKNNIKRLGSFTKRFPIVHKSLYETYNFFIVYILPIFYFYRKINFKKNKELSKFLGLQSIKKIKININLTSRKALSKSLKNNLKYGGWCVYYSNAFEILEPDLFPKFYQQKNIGLKILITNGKRNNQKISDYGLRPFGKFANVKEILRIGNRLSFLDLGPKIYDLVMLEDFNGIKVYAYLVENIDGKKLKEEDKILLDKFKLRLLKDKWLKPAFNSAIFMDDFSEYKEQSNFIKQKNGELKFVDFQSFSIINEKDLLSEIVINSKETSFGRKRIFSKKNYLYQLLPIIQNGKRDTLKRWKVFDQVFKKSKVSLKDKTILDIGCNLGMNSYYALFKGAKFIYGIDKKIISKKANILLSSLGSTRFKIFGLDLNSDIELKKIKTYIEEQIDVLFYCSVSGHIGFPNEINDLNCKYILFEGHVNTTVEENYKNLNYHSWIRNDKARLIFKTYLSDGDSGERPLFLIETNNN